MKENIIRVENLCKSYDGNIVLNNISFTVNKGEFVAFMGRSGCGKSTLLYCVSGMDQIDNGKVIFRGENMERLLEKEMEKCRLHHMGFIFQKANFLKNLSIRDNIIFPAFQAGLKSRNEIVEDAEYLMGHMGIAEIAAHDSRKVSGGQLQRAAICRAMINHPEILYGDEPTGALNSSATKEVMDIIEEIHQKGTTILLVTHDAKVAARADRVIYLEDGRIKAEYRVEKCKDSAEKMQRWLSEMEF